MAHINNIIIFIFILLNFKIYAKHKTLIQNNQFSLSSDERIIIPENLQKIQINAISPASAVGSEKFSLLKQFKELNINFILDKNISSIPYHSNNDAERFKQLQVALSNENKLIWTLRGGYGSARLFEMLKKIVKPEKEKIFIGYSDVTFLHLFFNQNWNWQTVHGATLADIFIDEKDSKNFSLIFELFSKNNNSLAYTNLEPMNTLAINTPSITGISTGGNLEIITNSIGTEWQIKTKNKIIFLEETNAKGYSIDRAFNHLIQANILTEAKAIILGNFLTLDENVEYALKRFAQEANIPVFKLPVFGHGKKNYPIILNTSTSIQNNRVTFQYDVNLFQLHAKEIRYAKK